MTVPGPVAEASLIGHMSGSTMLSVSVALQPSNLRGLEAYVEAVSNPKSLLYHHFLKPAEVGTRFGASASTVNSVVAYLKGKGLTITLSPDNRMAILAKGKASAMESAFNTKINLYADPGRRDGPKRFYSYATALKVSKSLAPNIVAVGGLQTAIVPHPLALLTPDQVRSVYSVDPLYKTSGRLGQGINVGITNYDGYLLSNVPLFLNAFKIPAPAAGAGSNITKVPIATGDDGEKATAAGEADLDIQSVLSMAPLSNVYIYDASTSQDGVALLTKVSQDNIVDIISESYGLDLTADTAPEETAEHNVHLAISAQGITYMAASGDVGTYGFGYPAIDPDVLAVGGTVASANSDGTRANETGWDGSGGGWRSYDVPWNRTPSYQLNSLTPLPIPSGVDRRFYPDIALHSAGSNGLQGRDPRYNGNDASGAVYWYIGGQLVSGTGTSIASPTFAGQLGLVLQDLVAQNAIDVLPSGKYRLGRIQDFLYTQVGEDPNVFFDVVQGGDIGPLPNGQEGLTTAGWDFVTGFGAPSLSGLRDAYLEGGLVALTDAASATATYSLSSPSIVLGTSPQGDATNLTTVDGSVYSLQSVRQTGVGQVAAATIDFALQGDSTKRRTVSLSVTLSSPAPTTEYVYLYNYTKTNSDSSKNYDLVQTVTGTGSMSTVSLTGIDMSQYVSNSTVRVLVRGLKPTRLGNSVFRVSVDRAVATEQVARK